jgi:hypothetical protein
VQRKMSQVLGAFGLLDFAMLRPVLPLAHVLELTNFISLIFFFEPRETADTESVGTRERL